MAIMRANVMGRLAVEDAYPTETLGVGMMTTEHAMSSYGLPVWVSGLTGKAHGPADLQGEIVLMDQGQMEEEAQEMIRLARSAGYTVYDGRR